VWCPPTALALPVRPNGSSAHPVSEAAFYNLHHFRVDLEGAGHVEFAMPAFVRRGVTRVMRKGQPLPRRSDPEVANMAVFLASDHAGAMTVANLTCGMSVEALTSLGPSALDIPR
jgi:hypothetical protein